MSNVLEILRTTVIKISLFFILLKKKNEKGISDSVVTQCSRILCYFTNVTWKLYISRFVPILAPNPGDATAYSYTAEMAAAHTTVE